MSKTESVKKSGFSSALWFIFIVGGTIGAGFLSGLLSGASAGYSGYTRPSFTPPDTTFSIVWPVLYFLTSVSFYMMLVTPAEGKNKAVKTAALILWGIQIALNLAWPFLFFTLDLKTIAFIVSTIMTVCVLAIIILCFFFCKSAAWLNIPYFLWLCFATYLGIFIALYN